MFSRVRLCDRLHQGQNLANLIRLLNKLFGVSHCYFRARLGYWMIDLRRVSMMHLKLRRLGRVFVEQLWNCCCRGGWLLRYHHWWTRFFASTFTLGNRVYSSLEYEVFRLFLLRSLQTAIITKEILCDVDITSWELIWSEVNVFRDVGREVFGSNSIVLKATNIATTVEPAASRAISGSFIFDISYA